MGYFMTEGLLPPILNSSPLPPENIRENGGPGQGWFSRRKLVCPEGDYKVQNAQGGKRGEGGIFLTSQVCVSFTPAYFTYWGKR